MNGNDHDGNLHHPHPAYERHEFDALKLCFENQVQLLRFMTQVDLRVFAGYITLQLLLGSWLTIDQIQDDIPKLGLSLIDGALATIAGLLLISNYLRRKEVSQVVWRLNKALGYTAPNVYLAEEAIHQPPTKGLSFVRAFLPIYLIGIAAGFAGILIMIFQ